MPPKPNPPALAQQALELASERKFGVFPMTAAKTPIRGTRGVRDATQDPAEIGRLFALPGAALIAIACGPASGVSALDLDRQHGAAAWWRANRDRLPPTLTWRTKSGGLHLLFRHDPRVRTTPLGRIGEGVEVRGPGASVIFWPAAGLPLLRDTEPADWPQWLLEAMAPPPRAAPPPPPPTWQGNDRRARAYAEAALRRAVERVARAAPGTRNVTLNSEAFSLARLVGTGAVSAGEIAYALSAAGLAAGLDRGEIAATLRSALRAGGGR
jgi:hypothetical protein